MSQRPAGERPGRLVWFGPAALGLALVSWLIPFGEVLAMAAVTSGGVSIATRREYRIDWTAVAGICVAAAQLYFAVLLFVMTTTGF